MILYHSSKKKDYSKIIEKQNFKINKKFKYDMYIDYLIDHISLHKTPSNLPGCYPGVRVKAPFMGHGIYGFEKEEEAEQYQSNGKVIKIDLKDDCYYFDLDDEDNLSEMNDMLKKCKEKIFTTITDDEVQRNYLLLIELIRACLYEEFEHSQPAVGILLYWRKDLLRNELPDLIRRTFTNSTYYLLTNKGKILSIT